MQSPSPHAPPPPERPPGRESIKDTLISIVIAFVLAFVFRGFVVEAFVIPTGSMAPTLLGAHTRFRGPESGYDWPVGPWEGRGSEAAPVQSEVVVHDPMTGTRVEKRRVPTRSGDRILVMKFLYAVLGPRRFDVVVFKEPDNPQRNFIKRLIGLPGEMVALVDGDIFVRPDDGAAAPGDDAWGGLSGWAIARKPVGVQRAVWQTVHDSRYAPVRAGAAGQVPWTSADPGWELEGPVYRYAGRGPTTLRWDEQRTRYSDRAPPWQHTIETWAIDDRYAYNELPPGNPMFGAWAVRFPVSDVRMRLGIDPGQDSQNRTVTATIAARGHEFAMEIAGPAVTVKMRARGVPAWTVLGSGTLPDGPLRAGRVTDLEFWHADQGLRVLVGGRGVDFETPAGRTGLLTYDWSPAERIRLATGRTTADLGEDVPAIQRPEVYARSTVSWTFTGPVTLHRVGLDRDLYYRPMGTLRGPGLSTHPSRPARLGPDEFFCLGDNSPASQDGRAWETVDPWVASEVWERRGLSARPGVVPRELMLGKAFFVYFPSLHKEATIPVPDVARMRFIR
ncbi:MAG TPA: signal peptidase I [Phycisphaerales bacterium]|nr:signal peptidase I [Phycisphaerales bacterium]